MYASFVLQCTSLGGNVNTRRMSQPDKFRPERLGFNMYAGYTKLQLTFLTLQPWRRWSFKKKTFLHLHHASMGFPWFQKRLNSMITQTGIFLPQIMNFRLNLSPGLSNWVRKWFKLCRVNFHWIWGLQVRREGGKQKGYSKKNYITNLYSTYILLSDSEMF